MRRYLIAGNWKMNTTRSSAEALAKAVAQHSHEATDSVDVVICPPFPYLIPVADAVQGSLVGVGAQDVYFQESGAYTGEVSLEMLLDSGCHWVILGHSERRHVLGETNELIGRKLLATLQKGLHGILCVGELLEERQANQTQAVLDRQMSGALGDVPVDLMERVIIAYEPVWAIGTGQTATPEQAESAHAHLRNWLETRYDADVANATRILYGGSVKASNAETLLSQPNVDGALVGGASLQVEDFGPIIDAGVKLA